MGIFNTDIKKLAVLLTPTFLRQPLLTAIARILMQPITTIQQTFLTMRDNNLYNLNHNGQACRLKHALNQLDGLQYDNGFEIEDINAIGNYIIIYNETEWLVDTGRVWLANDEPGCRMAYDENAISVETAAFIVCVPQQYQFNGSKPADPRIAATVEQYRLASRTAIYRIKADNN